MPSVRCIFAGTIRQARKVHPISDSDVPEGATHVSLWAREGEQGPTKPVFERKVFGAWKTWDGTAWTSRESHYVAQDLLTRTEG